MDYPKTAYKPARNALDGDNYDSRRCRAQSANKRQCGNKTKMRSPYCHVHTKKLQGLEVKDTPNMGKGLFAAKVFNKGRRGRAPDVVAHYTGVKKDVNYSDKRNRYIVTGETHAVDGENPAISGVARYANDCKDTGTPCNAYLRTVTPKTGVNKGKEYIRIDPLKRINPGEEITVEYGSRYWAERSDSDATESDSDATESEHSESDHTDHKHKHPSKQPGGVKGAKKGRWATKNTAKEGRWATKNTSKKTFWDGLKRAQNKKRNPIIIDSDSGSETDDIPPPIPKRKKKRTHENYQWEPALPPQKKTDFWDHVRTHQKKKKKKKGK